MTRVMSRQSTTKEGSVPDQPCVLGDGRTLPGNAYLADILAQPAALSALLTRAEADPALQYTRDRLLALAPGGFVLTGMGASLFAAQAATPALQARGIEAAAVDASDLLLYGLTTMRPGTTLIVVSQSGETWEVRELLSRVCGRVPVVGVTNHPGSTLGHAADVVLPLGVPSDASVAVKTYTGTLALLLLLGAALQGKAQRMSDDLFGAVADIATLLDHRDAVWDRLQHFLGAGDGGITFLGQGPSLASANEAALLLKEGAKQASEGVGCSAFRHGAIEVVEPGFRAVVFAPDGRSFTRARKVANEIVKHGGSVLAITSAPLEATERLSVLRLPTGDEFVTPLVEIVPLQLMAYHLALARGVEPGSYRNTTPVVRA